MNHVNLNERTQMKTAMVRLTMAVWATLLLLALTGRAAAAVSSTAKPKSFKGTVTAVDQKEKTFAVRGFWGTKTFNVGDHCKVSLEDKADAELKDLRPGYRVEVSHLENNGVRIASQVMQKNLVFTGNIAAIDPASRTLKAKRGTVTETFVAGDHCNVIIRNDRNRPLADLRIGGKVTVSYATPGGARVAQKIEQTGSTFTGTVEAIDADARTLKAQHLLSEKKFNLAKDCPIVIGGKSDGKLSDLRIGDKLSVHYEEMDGVLVATCVAREDASAKPAPAEVTRTETPKQ
jgi:Cu/Ag efflux protein CusF